MLGKVRWQLVALLFVAGIVNYLDRAALSVAAPLITKELGLVPSQLGFVLSSFFFSLARLFFDTDSLSTPRDAWGFGFNKAIQLPTQFVPSYHLPIS